MAPDAPRRPLEKVSLSPGGPRLVELANESEALAAKMAVTAKIETALVEEAAERAPTT
jgi:hypothetical protein